MTFYVEGRSKHELMPLERLFDKRLVNKAGQVNSLRTVDQKEWPEKAKNQKNNINLINQSYHSIINSTDEIKVVYAEQIMTFPVESLMNDSTLLEATKIFKKYKFRHLPVVSSTGKILGMVSDRDILKTIGNFCDTNNINLSQIKDNIKVESIMINEVLTANIKTDIRYIALLFIENRIGSIPIVHEGALVGIITRSDILKSITNHYEIELWT